MMSKKKQRDIFSEMLKTFGIVIIFTLLFMYADVTLKTLASKRIDEKRADIKTNTLPVVGAVAVVNKSTSPAQPESVQHIYTDADAKALAQMAWGECRGVNSLTANGVTVTGTYQKAAVMWCALNRYDAGYADSIIDVITAPYQFYGYSANNPVDNELLELAYDVLDRWEREHLQGGDVGRVLPAEYLFFVGDGQYNYFRDEFKNGARYTWELPDIYAEG